MTDVPGSGPVEVSVVVVVPAGQPLPDECLEAVRRHTPERHEVLLVAGDALDPPPGVRLVSPPAPSPYAAAADYGASLATGRVLCFLDPAARVTGGWLPPMVAAVTGASPVDRSAAVAVPMVVTKDGQVAEAGAVLHRDGTVEALGGRVDAGRPDHRFVRRTDGASATCVCILRSAFAEAGGFEARLEALAAAGTDLTAVLASSGRGAVYVPTSRVLRDGRVERRPLVAAASPDGRLLAERWGDSTPAGRSAAGSRPAEIARDTRSPVRVLVVAPCVPRTNGPTDERRVDRLLGDLAAVRPGSRRTLLAVDGHDSTRRAPRLLARGIEVATGAEDWDAWFDRRHLLFTTVVLTDLRRLGAVDRHLDRTQPQALRVLAPPSLDFRDLARLEPTVPSPEELDGFRSEVRLAEERLARRVASFDAVWCATRADREWVAGIVPGTPCTHVPLPARTEGGPGFDGRSGYVMLAARGADVIAGHEDAVVTAVRDVLPTLVAEDPSAVLRVVVDEPTPRLQRLQTPGVELVPAGDDPARWFRLARVCVADHRHGSGAREAIALALDTGTPFVTAAETLDEDLARLAPLVTAVPGPAVATLAARLHGDSATWQEAHTAVVQAATGPRSTAAARSALVRALATVGIVADRSAAIDEPQPQPVAAAPSPGPAVVRPRRVPLVGSATPRCDDDDLLLPPDEQYRLWRERFGPTPARLDDIRTRLEARPERPLVSVVLPVFNTDPVWLDEAVASVRTQLYGDWELCIGDDGTTRSETAAVLASHCAADPRIRSVRLPVSEGVVGSSNAALALATGDLVAFLGAGDLLKPHALAEVVLHLDRDPDVDVVYTDEDTLETDGRLVDPLFKPDWSPDQLLSLNYVGHLLVVRRALLEKLGGLRRGYDGAHGHDLVLRAAEVTDRIAHVPEPLYTTRRAAGTAAGTAGARPWVREATGEALADALRRRGTPGEVVDGLHPGTTRVRFAVRGRPLVSVIIPTRDRVDLLRPCVEGVLERSTYRDVELIVVDNQSDDPATLAYLATLPGRVVRYPHRFNYARMMNVACAEAGGDVLLLLNNDTEVVTPDWIESLLEHAQRPDVGIVGPRLRYPDGRVQHEGIITNYAGGMAGNVDAGGWWGLGDVVRDVTAVTGACAMVRPSVYWAVGGHDERLRVAFNDVDLCLRIRQAGYDVVYTPHAELRHVEGGTRGVHAHEDDDAVFAARWIPAECVDRFYSPQLCRRHPFRIRN
jgi:GT2 family glycosyltransferase